MIGEGEKIKEWIWISSGWNPNFHMSPLPRVSLSSLHTLTQHKPIWTLMKFFHITEPRSSVTPGLLSPMGVLWSSPYKPSHGTRYRCWLVPCLFRPQPLGFPHSPLVIFSLSPLMTDFPPTSTIQLLKVKLQPTLSLLTFQREYIHRISIALCEDSLQMYFLSTCFSSKRQTCTSNCLLDDSPPIRLKGTSNTTHSKSNFSPPCTT